MVLNKLKQLPPPIRKTLKIKRLGFWGVLKTLYLNFRILKFNDAIKFPILINGKVRIRNIHKGCIEFSECRFGILTFGVHLFELSVISNSSLNIEGKLIIKGDHYHDFAPGFSLKITKNGILELGDQFSVMDESRWFISSHSKIGNNNMYSWQVNILDTDAHPIIDEYGEIINKPKGISIGNNVWIGARSTILKGINISDGCIIASNSIITKNLNEPECIYVKNKVLKRKINWKRYII